VVRAQRLINIKMKAGHCAKKTTSLLLMALRGGARTIGYAKGQEQVF
jgi:hypothetical protein